jgi:hypothetical protein
MAKLPPLIPVGEDPPEDTHEESGQQNPAEGNWTVYSPNVLRGNLDNDKDFNNDVRMSVGWNSNVTSKQREMEPRAWMSTFAQQPYFPSGWGSSDDEAYVGLLLYQFQFHHCACGLYSITFLACKLHLLKWLKALHERQAICPTIHIPAFHCPTQV